MKRLFFSLSLLTLGAVLLHAEPVPPAVKYSSDPAHIGETSEAPMPHPVTKRTGGDVFVTLTRTAIPASDLPANTEVAVPEQFKLQDAQSAGDAVRQLTSVNVDRQGRLGSLRLAGIRGSSSNQTLILLDGRPVGGVGLNGSQDLSEIPVEQIDHIEVVRGGVSSLYGPNAIGGVINIISKRATYAGTPISHIGFEKRSYGNQTYRLDFGSRTGPLDYFFFGDQQAEGGFRDNSDARSYNIGGNLGLSMGKAGKVLFDIASYHLNSGQPGQISPDIAVNRYDNHVEKQSPTPDSRQVTTTNYLRTSYLLPLPANSMATFRLFGSDRQVEFQTPSYSVNTDRHEQSRGAEAQFELPYGFLAGGNFIRDRLDSRDLATPANNFIAYVENYGFFLQETFCWKTFTLIPSGRYDHNSQTGESKTPRVQLIDDLLPWLRLSGSAARSVRAPTLDDLFYPFTNYGGGFSYQGNPSLRPERAWTYDAGFEAHEGSGSVKVSYFRSNISDLIQTTSASASTTVNVGRARRQGMEIDAKQVVSPSFAHCLNYTYLENLGQPVGFNTLVDLRLSPRHTVNYLPVWTPTDRWTISNALRYQDSRWEGNNRSGSKLPSTFLWDIRFGYQIRQLELYIGAEDLTNKRYEDRGGYPLPGRRFFGGLSLRLWG